MNDHWIETNYWEIVEQKQILSKRDRNIDDDDDDDEANQPI